MTIDYVTDADEGYYMCTANNGIGSGLKKILHINVEDMKWTKINSNKCFIHNVIVAIKNNFLECTEIAITTTTTAIQRFDLVDSFVVFFKFELCMKLYISLPHLNVFSSFFVCIESILPPTSLVSLLIVL